MVWLYLHWPGKGGMNWRGVHIFVSIVTRCFQHVVLFVVCVCVCAPTVRDTGSGVVKFDGIKR